ncbi:MAG: superoxide dismutase family protein [Bacteroidota bacterium]
MSRRLLLLLPMALLGACTEADDSRSDAALASSADVAPSVATVRLDPLGESSATGTVTFTETDDGLRVEYDLTGVELGGHGFHVHENGACGRGDDGTPGGAAGGHFNPLGTPHGPREADREGRHVGDLGNVTSERGGVTGGVAIGSFVDPLIALDGPNGIVGRSVVLHLKADDEESQPSGDAGARIACGVIQLASPPEGV